MIKVNVQTLECSREPVPDSLQGLDPITLLDLMWTSPSIGLRPYAWWPEEDQSPVLTRHTRYGLESFLADPDRKVVIVHKAVMPWSAEEIIADKLLLMAEIDDLVASRMASSIRFQLGYELREAAANAYKTSGYTSTPSDWIMRFATNVGKTAQEATDIILTQATGLRQALKELEGFRMDKFQIYFASTGEQAVQICTNLKASIQAVVIP